MMRKGGTEPRGADRPERTSGSRGPSSGQDSLDRPRSWKCFQPSRRVPPLSVPSFLSPSRHIKDLPMRFPRDSSAGASEHLPLGSYESEPEYRPTVAGELRAGREVRRHRTLRNSRRVELRWMNDMSELLSVSSMSFISLHLSYSQVVGESTVWRSRSGRSMASIRRRRA